jgi:hypothetical protein
MGPAKTDIGIMQAVIAKKYGVTASGEIKDDMIGLSN